jgi:uncharacterized protein YbjT (DUF2867 family)
MRVLVIGANGGTGRALVDLLLEDGHEVRGLIRDPAQGQALRDVGATPVAGDLEGDLDGAFDDLDAVMFCAGSGSSTGPDATLRVDLHGAVRAIDHCVEHGVGRFVMLSSIGAADPLQGPETLRPYLAAKHAADRILLASGLDATVVRPGGLTDDEPTGRVRIGVPALGDGGRIPRRDVAAVMARSLHEPATIGATFELVSGDTEIATALASV